MHSRSSASLCRGPEIGRVSEHLRQWNERLHKLSSAWARLHFFDAATTTIKVARNCSNEILGGHNFDAHHGLKQHGFRLLNRILKCKRSGDVERTLVGIDFVVRTKKKPH